MPLILVRAYITLTWPSMFVLATRRMCWKFSGKRSDYRNNTPKQPVHLSDKTKITTSENYKSTNNANHLFFGRARKRRYHTQTEVVTNPQNSCVEHLTNLAFKGDLKVNEYPSKLLGIYGMFNFDGLSDRAQRSMCLPRRRKC